MFKACARMMATVWRASCPRRRRPQDRWRRATKTLSCYSRDLASRTGTLDGSQSNPPCRRNRFRAERQAARFYPAALFGSPLGYGWIPIPVASIKNGNGPRILLMAGNHGDEYEGQVALGKLIRSLEPAEVSGRIIICPQRTSRRDGRNAHFAARRGQPQPQLPGRSLWRPNRADRRLHIGTSCNDNGQWAS
jgi:Succinylglutamate desuccinylase / Aspartoacylase family